MSDWISAHAPALYGAAALVAIALAFASDRHVWVKVSLFLLLDWIGCNVIEQLNGYDRAPLLLPMMEAILGTAVGMLALANRSILATLVFGLFVSSCIIWDTAFWAHAQSSFACYLTLNMVYLLGVLVVGCAGGWAVVADRPRRSVLRLGHHPVGG